MKIKAIFKQEIIEILAINETWYKKTYYDLNGVEKKHKIININKCKIDGRYFMSIENLFTYLVNNKAYSEV